MDPSIFQRLIDTWYDPLYCFALSLARNGENSVRMKRSLPVLMLFLTAMFGRLTAGPTLSVPADSDASSWDRLLKTYVNEQGLVNYRSWKENPGDLKALDVFISNFEAAPKTPAQGASETAALINLYNALTIRWILQNYPTESIRALDDSFGGARWRVGGRTISVDEIEHKNLRPLYGWKVHATIVCAARSCPPLQREAYTVTNLETLTTQAFRAWLGRNDLNRFEPAAKRVVLSPIFKWFKGDFTGQGELPKVLAHFGPEAHRLFLSSGDFKIDYLDYHWGLNDQSGLGGQYRAGFFDRMFGNAK
jgi:hypothetical protein